jgi:hypothetical protein
MKRLQKSGKTPITTPAPALAALTGGGEKVCDLKDFFSATLPVNGSFGTHCTGFRTAPGKLEGLFQS